MIEFSHIPVLYDEVMEALAIQPGGIYADGTLGGGGHAYGICRKALTAESGHFLGVDQDEAALEAAGRRLEAFGRRAELHRANFAQLPALIKSRFPGGIQGILLDLGVSSHQLDEAGRGFSYRQEAPLDMRMDRRQTLTAAHIVNQYTQAQLSDLFQRYGEEAFARNIAKHICLAREKGPIEGTEALAQIVKAAIPARMRQKGHPAKQTFQALRIEVNKELQVLESFLDEVWEALAPGGRLCIITFHSLEDRMVKQAFAKAAKACVCPPHFPVCVCGRRNVASLPYKARAAGEQEIDRNPRAKSARLRVAEKLPG